MEVTDWIIIKFPWARIIRREVGGDRSGSGVLEPIGKVLSSLSNIKASPSFHSVSSIPPPPHPPTQASLLLQELWNLTFKSTLPGAWAAQSRSYPNAPTNPSLNNSPLNLLPVRPDTPPPLPPVITSILTLSLFTVTKQSNKATPNVRPKKGAVRGKGGLAHGTGRVKPNGTIRRSDSNSSKGSVPEPTPVEPSKQRLVIEQGPTPLYCSDQCRLVDLNASRGIVESDYNPDRQSPPPPPVPHNSFSSIAFTTSQDSESDASSFTDLSVELTDTDRCHARLAPLYGFPPLPPRPHLLQPEPEQRVDPSKEFQSGVMMAAQRIKANLSKPPPKRSSFAHLNKAPEPLKPIPGWTDGTDGWRAEVYSLAKPRDHSLPYDERSDPKRAYKGFVATSQRQGGVYSTLDQKYHVPQPFSDGSELPPRNKTVDELYSKYNLAFARRSESRSSIQSSPSVLSMPRSLPTTVAPIVKKKEVPILKKGAEGRLLVPDVKLKVSTSYVNVSGSPASSRMTRRASGFSDGSRNGLNAEDELTFGSRPVESQSFFYTLSLSFAHLPPQVRAWSYDNVLTYPCMVPPVRTEKRVEKQVVDGVEQQVEVEVELPLKRLFLFPGKEVR